LLKEFALLEMIKGKNVIYKVKEEAITLLSVGVYN
jgi:hypothetical protein